MIKIERAITINVDHDTCWVRRDMEDGKIRLSSVTLKDPDQLAAFAEALADVAQTMKQEAAAVVA